MPVPTFHELRMIVPRFVEIPIVLLQDHLERSFLVDRRGIEGSHNQGVLVAFLVEDDTWNVAAVAYDVVACRIRDAWDSQEVVVAAAGLAEEEAVDLEAVDAAIEVDPVDDAVAEGVFGQDGLVAILVEVRIVAAYADQVAFGQSFPSAAQAVVDSSLEIAHSVAESSWVVLLVEVAIVPSRALHSVLVVLVSFRARPAPFVVHAVVPN